MRVTLLNILMWILFKIRLPQVPARNRLNWQVEIPSSKRLILL